MVASAIVYTGVRILSRSSRVLMDEALPQEELDIVRKLIADYPGPELEGFHKLRGRRAGSARYIDLHLQFTPGTSLERAHAVAHELQAEVRERIPARRPARAHRAVPRGGRARAASPAHRRARRSRSQGRRLTAAARPTNASTALYPS